MRRLLALFLLAASAPAFGWDWGVSQNLASVIVAASADGPLFVESSKSTLYLSVPLDGVNLRAEGIMDVSATAAQGSWSVADPRLDFGTVAATGLLPLGVDADGKPLGVIDFAVGRSNLADASSGWVASGRFDGASASYLAGSMHLDGKLYYSGLVLKKNSKVSVGAADAKDGSDSTVVFAPKHLLGSVTFGLSEAFERQDLQAELLGQYDLRAGTSAVHSFYTTLGASGPAFGGFRHQTSLVGSLAVASDSTKVGLLATSEWSANLPLGRLVASATWAQGLGEGATFIPLAGRGLASVTSLSTANGAVLAGDFSIKPAPRVNAGLKGDILLRANPAQAAAMPDFRATSTDMYLGSEATLYGSWTATSELSVGWNFGVFLPNGNAVVDGTPPTYLAVLTATLEL